MDTRLASIETDVTEMKIDAQVNGNQLIDINANTNSLVDNLVEIKVYVKNYVETRLSS